MVAPAWKCVPPWVWTAGSPSTILVLSPSSGATLFKSHVLKSSSSSANNSNTVCHNPPLWFGFPVYVTWLVYSKVTRCNFTICTRANILSLTQVAMFLLTCLSLYCEDLNMCIPQLICRCLHHATILQVHEYTHSLNTARTRPHSLMVMAVLLILFSLKHQQPVDAASVPSWKS